MFFVLFTSKFTCPSLSVPFNRRATLGRMVMLFLAGSTPGRPLDGGSGSGDYRHARRPAGSSRKSPMRPKPPLRLESPSDGVWGVSAGALDSASESFLDRPDRLTLVLDHRRRM